MKNNDKTNVMRVLDQKKIAYESHTYEADPTLSGEEIAGILGLEEKAVREYSSAETDIRSRIDSL